MTPGDQAFMLALRAYNAMTLEPTRAGRDAIVAYAGPRIAELVHQQQEMDIAAATLVLGLAEVAG